MSTRATHVMDSVLAEWAFAVYRKDGATFVFTGPYKVDTFVAGDSIALSPNAHYHDGKVRARRGMVATCRTREDNGAAAASPCHPPSLPRNPAHCHHLSTQSPSSQPRTANRGTCWPA